MGCLQGPMLEPWKRKIDSPQEQGKEGRQHGQLPYSESDHWCIQLCIAYTDSAVPLCIADNGLFQPSLGDAGDWNNADSPPLSYSPSPSTIMRNTQGIVQTSCIYYLITCSQCIWVAFPRGDLSSSQLDTYGTSCMQWGAIVSKHDFYHFQWVATRGTSAHFGKLVQLILDNQQKR